ncbi:(2Fe-2S)-binding protein [Sedimentitalea sp. XS_ASV28]|uniref:(2Fe-2S)-binding protein n=1 Tax=Sedimentitalea sp. XS_ASV28 TaxID=3241296 RepID=UPI003512A2A4
MKQIVELTINGDPHSLAVEGHRSLLDTLREEAGLTGTKKGCDVGDCGACTVIVDGKPVNACLVLAVEAQGSNVETVEGMQQSIDILHPLQDAFMRHGASQCGFCTPGILMMARQLIEDNPDPSDAEIRFGLSGNICRCTGYTKIFDAVRSAAADIRAKRAQEETA